MKIQELPKENYVYRYKTIVFNGGVTPVIQQRSNNEIDEWDKVFSSKEDFQHWYSGVVVGLAELDQCLNYCKHFVRTKGNEGNYVRNGKTYPVDGSWCGIHDYGIGESGKFFKWAIENFGENWYELMDRYK